MCRGGRVDGDPKATPGLSQRGPGLVSEEAMWAVCTPSDLYSGSEGEDLAGYFAFT